MVGSPLPTYGEQADLDRWLTFESMEWRLMRFYTEFKMVLFDSDLDWIGIVFCLDSFEVGLDSPDPISFIGDCEIFFVFRGSCRFSGINVLLFFLWNLNCFFFLIRFLIWIVLVVRIGLIRWRLWIIFSYNEKKVMKKKCFSTFSSSYLDNFRKI